MFCHQNLTAPDRTLPLPGQGKDPSKSKILFLGVDAAISPMICSIMQHWHGLNCGETRVLCNKDNALSSRLKNFPFISVCFLQVTNHSNLNIWNANARRILHRYSMIMFLFFGVRQLTDAACFVESQCRLGCSMSPWPSAIV